MDIQAFGVEEWLNVWENDAIYDIAGSSIASMALDEILELGDGDKETMLAQVLGKTMNYGWIEGSPEFKEEVAKLYQGVQPTQILQTNGATGANHLALYALVEPGDHVISMYPTYQQLVDIPRSFGSEVSLWQIQEENQWLPSLEELKTLLRPQTKLICINNANNPTGAIMDRVYLEELVKIAREVPAIVDLYERGISTNSLSKTYSVPGVRVGWIVANAELSDRFRKYRDYTMICAGVFDDFLATHVLRHRDLVLARNRSIVYRNLELVKKWVAQEPRVSVILPRHVSTSFIKLDIPEDTETFCIRLLKEQGVLLVPGNRFDRPGYARLGYCTQTDILEQGLAKLSQFLRQYDA